MPLDPSTYSGVPNGSFQNGQLIQTGLAGPSRVGDYIASGNLVYAPDGTLLTDPNKVIPAGAQISLNAPPSTPYNGQSPTGGYAVQGTQIPLDAETIRHSQSMDDLAWAQFRADQAYRQGQGSGGGGGSSSSADAAAGRSQQAAQFSQSIALQRAQLQQSIVDANRQYGIDVAQFGESQATRLFNERLAQAQLGLQTADQQLQGSNFQLNQNTANFNQRQAGAQDRLQVLQMLADRSGPQDLVAYTNLLRGLNAPNPQASTTIDPFAAISGVVQESNIVPPTVPGAPNIQSQGKAPQITIPKSGVTAPAGGSTYVPTPVSATAAASAGNNPLGFAYTPNPMATYMQEQPPPANNGPYTGPTDPQQGTAASLPYLAEGGTAKTWDSILAARQAAADRQAAAAPPPTADLIAAWKTALANGTPLPNLDPYFHQANMPGDQAVADRFSGDQPRPAAPTLPQIPIPGDPNQPVDAVGKWVQNPDGTWAFGTSVNGGPTQTPMIPITPPPHPAYAGYRQPPAPAMPQPAYAGTDLNLGRVGNPYGLGGDSAFIQQQLAARRQQAQGQQTQRPTIPIGPPRPSRRWQGPDVAGWQGKQGNAAPGQMYLAGGGTIPGGAMAVVGDSPKNRPGTENREIAINLNPDPNDQIMVIPISKLGKAGKRLAGKAPHAATGGTFGTGNDPNNIQLNSYSNDVFGNLPFIQAIKGQRQVTPYQGFGASIGNPSLGLYDLPGLINMKTYNNLGDTEQKALGSIYSQGAGMNFNDILKMSQAAAFTGGRSPAAMYGA